jgi:hypothetical protein
VAGPLPGGPPSGSARRAREVGGRLSGSTEDAQCMKPSVRGKYLVTEHAVELRRIIPAPPIALADDGPVRYHGGIATARAATGGRTSCCWCVTSGHREVSGNRV